MHTPHFHYVLPKRLEPFHQPEQSYFLLFKFLSALKLIVSAVLFIKLSSPAFKPRLILNSVTIEYKKTLRFRQITPEWVLFTG
jgi:hypothetical protein